MVEKEIYYKKNNPLRISQGDLLTNVKIPILKKELDIVISPYLIVLSQDCDLNQDFDAHNQIKTINFDESNKKISSFYNKMIPSIVVVPAYPADNLREGTHLNFLDLEMTKIGKEKDTRWKILIQNETPRYHYLGGSENLDIINLALDFKRYYTLSREYLYSVFPECYFLSLKELYREDLSHRFFNFQSRIGLP
ncbi:hypothetical protein [Methanobrevibacter sp.]|uniref:hypothetical protein n=1 Tax=Methanobrevibacter sp. TaxID=66852 RepID=UPI0039770DEF